MFMRISRWSAPWSAVGVGGRRCGRWSALLSAVVGGITSVFFALSYHIADKAMSEVEGNICGCGLTFACMFGGSQSYMGFM